MASNKLIFYLPNFKTVRLYWKILITHKIGIGRGVWVLLKISFESYRFIKTNLVAKYIPTSKFSQHIGSDFF